MAETTLSRPRRRVPLGGFWRALRRWWAIRSSIRTLNALDPRMLRDIGLDRYDIEAAVRDRIDGSR